MKVNAVFKFELAGEAHTGTLVIKENEESAKGVINSVYGVRREKPEDESVNLQKNFPEF